jgi:hypothetical protein
VGSSRVLLKPAIEFFFFCELLKEFPKNDLYICFAIVLLKKKQVKPSFLHLQHTRYQLSLEGAGLCGLGVDSVNSSSTYFAYFCIPESETTLHHK